MDCSAPTVVSSTSLPDFRQSAIAAEAGGELDHERHDRAAASRQLGL
jgi:hypothetical protein